MSSTRNSDTEISLLLSKLRTEDAFAAPTLVEEEKKELNLNYPPVTHHQIGSTRKQASSPNSIASSPLSNSVRFSTSINNSSVFAPSPIARRAQSVPLDASSPYLQRQYRLKLLRTTAESDVSSKKKFKHFGPQYYTFARDENGYYISEAQGLRKPEPSEPREYFNNTFKFVCFYPESEEQAIQTRKPEMRIGLGHHYYLANLADEVWFAGEITFDQGAITSITNQSGAYSEQAEWDEVKAKFDLLGLPIEKYNKYVELTNTASTVPLDMIGLPLEERILDSNPVLPIFNKR